MKTSIWSIAFCQSYQEQHRCNDKANMPGYKNVLHMMVFLSCTTLTELWKFNLDIIIMRKYITVYKYMNSLN